MSMNEWYCILLIMTHLRNTSSSGGAEKELLTCAVKIINGCPKLQDTKRNPICSEKIMWKKPIQAERKNGDSIGANHGT